MIKKLPKIIVFCEIIVIIYLIVDIYVKFEDRNNVLSSFSESPVRQDKLTIPEGSVFKYYREFTPNQKVTDSRSWIKGPIIYNINSETLNDRFEYSTDKKPDIFRIITLGDSFTFGQLVNTPDNWPEKLEDTLNSDIPCKGTKYEVINLGMMGYGVEYLSHRYSLHGKKYNPDLIVWFESGSGFDRINEIVMPMIEKFRAQMSEEEIKKASDSGTFPDWEEGFKEFHQTYSEEQITDNVKNSWQKFLTERGKTRVLITTFASISPAKKDLLRNWTSNFENVLIYDGIPWIGFGGNLKLKDGHPNKNGHLMIASNVFKYLKDNNLVPCNN